MISGGEGDGGVLVWVVGSGDLELVVSVGECWYVRWGVGDGDCFGGKRGEEFTEGGGGWGEVR